MATDDDYSYYDADDEDDGSHAAVVEFPRCQRRTARESATTLLPGAQQDHACLRCMDLNAEKKGFTGQPDRTLAGRGPRKPEAGQKHRAHRLVR